MFSQTLAHRNSKNEIKKSKEEEGKRRVDTDFLKIIWFLTATSGTKPIIVSAGHVYSLYSLAPKREMRKYH